MPSLSLLLSSLLVLVASRYLNVFFFVSRCFNHVVGPLKKSNGFQSIRPNQMIYSPIFRHFNLPQMILHSCRVAAGWHINIWSQRVSKKDVKISHRPIRPNSVFFFFFVNVIFTTVVLFAFICLHSKFIQIYVAFVFTSATAGQCE